MLDDVNNANTKTNTMGEISVTLTDVVNDWRYRSQNK